ncbi:hypothetical protein H5410_048979 [Solanum commersonii]|uniref:Uncharacterized protein n=1 Tax=Solanum commersonii TaxID=4109 RepID=A0A9J5XJT2_SOLCO|nr:hypothetical protein H5410_048979 [Solanum commersonii]
MEILADYVYHLKLQHVPSVCVHCLEVEWNQFDMPQMHSLLPRELELRDFTGSFKRISMTSSSGGTRIESCISMGLEKFEW